MIARPSPEKSAYRNVTFCSLCKMTGCDFGHEYKSPTAQRTDVKSEWCTWLKKLQVLTVRI